MSLIKSKQRVVEHGEVFTPDWLVEAMLDVVKGETDRIDSRFLEPACGSGNFLIPVLQRKLAIVELKFGKSDFNKQHYGLLSVMCMYGIEFLLDNIQECRSNMLGVISDFFEVTEDDLFWQAASHVLKVNLVHGNAINMKTINNEPISFAEWGYLGKGKYQRRDFRLDVLTGASEFSAEGSLFAGLASHEIFRPTKTYSPMSLEDLAQQNNISFQATT